MIVTASPIPDREMTALAGLVGQSLENGGRETDHLHLVKRAGGQCKKRPADAVSLGVLELSDVPERHHRLGKMKCRAGMQADALAQFGKADVLPITCHFLEDCDGAIERLHAAALAAAAFVVQRRCPALGNPRDFRRRPYQTLR